MAGRYIRPSFQYFDNSGRILDSGQLFFYDSGTTTLKNVFSDPDGLVPIANPVVLDGAGRTPNVYLEGSYKLIIQDKNDVQIEERDPVLAADDTTKGFADWNAVTTYSAQDIVRASNGLLYLSIVSSNQNNEPSASAVQWTQVQFLRSYNANETYVIGNVVVDSIGDVYRSLTNGNVGNTPSSSPTDWTSIVAGAFAGNVTVGGTLGVTGAATFSSSISAVKVASEANFDTVAGLLASGDYAGTFNSINAGAAGRAQGMLIAGGAGFTRGAALVAEAKSGGNDTDLIFAVSSASATPTERMRLDASGRLLIGKTVATGYALDVAKANLGAAGFDRTGSDGELIAFRKDGATVGNIEVTASGIAIKLGGTAAANLLDDYETGLHVATMTPISSGTITLGAATDSLAYVKVGQIVNIHGMLQISSVSSPTGIYVNISLPFAIANLSDAAERFGGAVTYFDSSAGTYTTLTMTAISGSDFRVYVDSSTLAATDAIFCSFNYSTDL
jgi:hypothetical protein